MIVDLGRGRSQSGGQVRKQFVNVFVVALHIRFLLITALCGAGPFLRSASAREFYTNSFNCVLNVSYARNSNDLVADSLNFKTSAICR